MGKKTVIAVIMTIIGIAAVGIGAYQLWHIHWQDSLR